MNVVFYHRLPQPDGNYSIERLFADVRASLPADITPIVSQCRFRSVGLWKRVYNVLEAACGREMLTISPATCTI